MRKVNYLLIGVMVDVPYLGQNGRIPVDVLLDFLLHGAYRHAGRQFQG